MASNTSPSWEEPALADVEAVVVAEVADVVRELGLLRRPPEACLRSRQLLQLNAETMLHRRQRLQLNAEQMLHRRQRLAITTRNCLFTLLRTEDFGC